MPQYEISWVEAAGIRPQDLDKPCRQVYVWIITQDKQIVIVSKEEDRWQLPGGKPEPGETLKETAVREVWEETGLDISQLSDSLQFIGYQTVKDVEREGSPYLQVRYLLELNTKAATLELGVQNEGSRQSAEDIINSVGSVGLDRVVERIPWLDNSPEFNTVQSFVKSTE